MLEKLREGVICESAEETMHLAELVAQEMPAGVIALCGDLGAGKTTFAKGLAKGLGIKESVKSPSYNVCLTYAGTNSNFAHIDAYRLSGAEAFEALLIDEILPDPKLVCIEWAEIVKDALPEDTLWIKITGSEKRLFKVEK